MHSLLAEQLAEHMPGLGQPSEGLASFIAAVDESYRQADEGRRFEQELIHLANHDPLTGLYNRRRFQDELERELTLADNDTPPGALLFLDVDQFKDVNDSLGHRAGDELLKGLAVLLQTCVREGDVLARSGGDEFCLLLPNATSST